MKFYVVYIWCFVRFESTFTYDLTLINENAVVRNGVSTYLKCVTDQGEVTHDAFKREKNTGTGDRLPSMALVGPISPEEWPGKRLSMFKDAGMERTGLFSCEAKNLKTNILMRALAVKIGSEANLWPDRFTYVAYVGEENVTIAFKAFDPTLTVRWRLEGNRISGVSLTRNIQRVSRTDAGLYECYVSSPDVKNSDSYRPGYQAMLRLIVKQCPRGKWNPPYCESACLCINGGLCDDLTGNCVCPPGFSGDVCDQECGGNRFGASCQFHCKNDGSTHGEDAEECKGRQFCLPDPYGCSCATGFMGLECLNGCPKGLFGADCRQTCHCKREDLCNRFTGACTMGCAGGWKGPSCQTECENKRWGEGCENDCHCLNEDDCNKVNGECPNGCATPFIGKNCQVDSIDSCSPNPCGNGGTCTDLIDGFKCHCVNGTSGTNCETDLDDCASNPCLNEAECEDTGQLSFICHCISGFTGTRCETNIDDCKGNKCKNDAECHDQILEYQCHCKDGYSGRFCERGLNIPNNPQPTSGGHTLLIVASSIGLIALVAAFIAIWYYWSRKNKTRLQHIGAGRTAW